MTAARRLARYGLNVVALNFASARNPGGGWLTGAEAQEESLARSSALVAALTAPGPCAAHYADGSGSRDALYTHDMIYSPAVPVFRDEASLQLLPQPWPLAFISAAAPNAGVAVRKHAVSAKAVEAIYAERAERVLALAHKRGHDAIVLGAWGCGVFQNDPPMVARVFGRLLHGRFRGCFRVVAFPILGRDANPRVYAAFDALASEGDGALPEVELEAGLAAAPPDAVPTAPTVSERSLSESYGAGASQYEEAALAEWKARGQLAADAAKRKDWQAASAEFAACVELRPDWEKGHACLARVQAKVAAAAQQQPEHQSGVVSAEAEAGAVAQATEEGAGAAGMVALELESDGGSDAHSVAAVGVVPSFNVGRGVALEDTAVDLTRVEAAQVDALLGELVVADAVRDQVVNGAALRHLRYGASGLDPHAPPLRDDEGIPHDLVVRAREPRAGHSVPLPRDAAVPPDVLRSVDVVDGPEHLTVKRLDMIGLGEAIGDHLPVRRRVRA